MEKYVLVNSSNELYHHGIKGMKWGVIRSKLQLGYRNSERRKTKAAIKSIKKQNAMDIRTYKIQKKNQSKIDRATEKANAKLNKVKGVSDINRNQFVPKKDSAIKGLGQEVFNQAVKPVLINAGKNWIASKFNKPTEMEKLTKQYDILKKKKDIDDLLHPKPKEDDLYTSMKKAYANYNIEKQYAKMQKEVNDSKQKDLYENEFDANRKAEKESYRESNTSSTYSNSNSSKTERWSGTVETSPAVVNSGKSYLDSLRSYPITGYLEDKSGR